MGIKTAYTHSTMDFGHIQLCSAEISAGKFKKRFGAKLKSKLPFKESMEYWLSQKVWRYLGAE